MFPLSDHCGGDACYVGGRTYNNNATMERGRLQI